MKKLVLALALALSSAATFATTTNPVNIVKFQDEYTEIKTAELPQAIADKVKASGATVEKAWVNKNKEYKLDIKSGETKSTVYYAADGTSIAK